MSKNIKDKVITFRITMTDFDKLKALAALYSNGDVSRFIRICVLENHVPVLKSRVQGVDACQGLDT